PRGGTSPAPVSQQPRGELTPAHASARAPHATVQITGPRPAVPLGLWSHRPALPSASASVDRARLSTRATATISDLARDYNPIPSRLREARGETASLVLASRRCK